jgi:hypothetical protein
LKNNWNGFYSVVVGFIGEIVFLRALRKTCGGQVSVQLADTHDYDIIIKPNQNDSSKAMRIEIKTRRTRCRLKPGYINCVSGHNFTQETDVYVFLRLLYTGKSSGKVLFSGACTRSGFHKQKTFAATGTRVGSLPIKHDCFWIPLHTCVSFRCLQKTIDSAFTTTNQHAGDAATTSTTTSTANETQTAGATPAAETKKQEEEAHRVKRKHKRKHKSKHKESRSPTSPATLSDCLWKILG